MKKCWILVPLILIMFCACSAQPNSEESNTSSSDNAGVFSGSSPASSTSISEANLTPQQTDNLTSLVSLYETFSKGETPDRDTPVVLVMSLLDSNGAPDIFVSESDHTFILPYEQTKKIAALFLDDTLIRSQNDLEYSCDGCGKRKGITTELFDATTDGDEITAVFGRFVTDENGDKQWLWPVRYHLVQRETAQEDIPAEMQNAYKPEDLTFRIKSVENIYDYETAKEIYIQNGYEDLFEEKTYELSSPQDILDMADRVNSGVYNETRATYILKNDIDMGEFDFRPIGTNKPFIRGDDHRNPNQYGFGGIFEGNGYSISGISYTGTPSADSEKENIYGFFSILGNGAKVFDLNITDANIGYEAADAKVEAGILAGRMESAQIENCSVSGTVSGTINVGGLVGNVTGDLRTTSGDPPESRITNCHGSVTVKGESYVGGLLGINHRAVTSGCTVEGTVIIDKLIFDPDTPNRIGGFAGHHIWASIENCAAQVEIKTLIGVGYIGSFIGMSEDNVYNCFYNSNYSAWKPCGSERSDKENQVKGFSASDYEQEIALLQKNIKQP